MGSKPKANIGFQLYVETVIESLPCKRKVQHCRATMYSLHIVALHVAYRDMGLKIRHAVCRIEAIQNVTHDQCFDAINTHKKNCKPQPYHMSLVMRKPAFCICKNKDADQLRVNREADQRLCFRYTDSTIPLLPKYKISSL